MSKRSRILGSMLSVLALAASAHALTAVPTARPRNVPGRASVRAPAVAPETALRTLQARWLSPSGTPAGGAEITPEILALAHALKNDPKLIYEFVKNTIEFVPIYGSIKGATATFLDGRGNDFDQSSLMIALLKAAGFSPTYIYGTIRLNPSQLDNW